MGKDALDKMFSYFEAIDSQGGFHKGVRPSQLPESLKPFKAVRLNMGGSIINPFIPDGYTVIGYEYAVTYGVDADTHKNETLVPKITALLENGRKFVTTFDLKGRLVSRWG